MEEIVNKTEECKIKKIRKKQEVLKNCYFENDNSVFLEIGVDEAGRGPMFGRVYVAAVILPKDPKQFDHSKVKDSKKFHSEKKIKEVAEYIKTHAIAWSIKYAEHNVIDKLNIRRATLEMMHEAISEVCTKMKEEKKEYYLLIDGNDFIPMMYLQNENLIQLPYKTIEGGDNIYACIAAASILAKVSRDEYIMEICKENPDLQEKYDLENNKGYGTKKHMDGIKKYGISQWHRKSFGICKEF